MKEITRIPSMKSIRPWLGVSLALSEMVCVHNKSMQNASMFSSRFAFSYRRPIKTYPASVPAEVVSHEFSENSSAARNVSKHDLATTLSTICSTATASYLIEKTTRR